MLLEKGKIVYREIFEELSCGVLALSGGLLCNFFPSMSSNGADLFFFFLNFVLQE